MGKINVPLMSFEVSGTLAKAVTFQHSAGQNIVRKKPEIPFSLTLPQQYQRWLYQDYCTYWQTLTPTQKQVYASLAVGKHMSGFALFMRTMLSTLPDIALWLPLDTLSAATTPDFSKNAYHGTVAAGSIASGRISTAIALTGAASQINCGAAPKTNFTTENFTICLWVYFNNLTGIQTLFSKSGWTLYGYYFDMRGGGSMWVAISNPPAIVGDTIATGLTAGIWTFVAVRKLGATISVFKNQTKFTSALVFPNPKTSPLDTLIGDYGTGGLSLLNGKADHVIAYSRALSDTEILLRSTRQYPHPL